MISKIFQSRIPSCNYCFKDGTKADFIFGRYTTANEAHITELMAEIKIIGKELSMNPYLFVDENEQEVDSEALTPFELMKIQAKKEALAELEAAGKMSDVVSSSDTNSFKASMTNSTGENAAESNGAPVTAGLAKLAAMVKK